MMVSMELGFRFRMMLLFSPSTHGRNGDNILGSFWKIRKSGTEVPRARGSTGAIQR